MTKIRTSAQELTDVLLVNIRRMEKYFGDKIQSVELELVRSKGDMDLFTLKYHYRRPKLTRRSENGPVILTSKQFSGYLDQEGWKTIQSHSPYRISRQ